MTQILSPARTRALITGLSAAALLILALPADARVIGPAAPDNPCAAVARHIVSILPKVHAHSRSTARGRATHSSSTAELRTVRGSLSQFARAQAVTIAGPRVVQATHTRSPNAIRPADLALLDACRQTPAHTPVPLGQSSDSFAATLDTLSKWTRSGS